MNKKEIELEQPDLKIPEFVTITARGIDIMVTDQIQKPTLLVTQEYFDKYIKDKDYE